MNAATRKQEYSVVEPMLYMALELSNTTWNLPFDSSAERHQPVARFRRHARHAPDGAALIGVFLANALLWVANS